MRPTEAISCIGLVVILSCGSPGVPDAGAEQSGSARIDVNLFASAVLPGGGAVMVGDRGKIFLSKDGAGGAWKEIESGTTRALAAVCFPDDRQGWVAGQAGVIVHSADGGGTWRTQASGVETYLLDIDFADPRHGMAVGADSTIVTTSDGGRTWRRSLLASSLDLTEAINLFAVAMLDTRTACITGDGGRIFRTEDGGRSWRVSASPLYDEEMMEGRILYSMVYDAGILYAVGVDGVLVTSRDQGKTWVEGETGFPGPELYCIDVVDGMGVAAGSGGHIIRTTDAGSTWTLVEVPEGITRCWLSGVDLRKTPAGDLRGLIVGEDGTFGRMVKGAFSW